jgi:hypothetical protein
VRRSPRSSRRPSSAPAPRPCSRPGRSRDGGAPRRSTRGLERRTMSARHHTQPCCPTSAAN